jgi:hypothetical protein
MMGDRMMGLVVCRGDGKIICGQNHYDWVGAGLQMYGGTLMWTGCEGERRS